MSNLPSVRPTLNLQFNNQPTVQAMTAHIESYGGTFSRSGNDDADVIASYFDSLGVMQFADENEPRPYYAPADDGDIKAGEHLGILIEESRENLITYSEDFDNAAWVKVDAGTGSTPTVNTDSQDAPDGETTADEVTFDLNGGTTTSDQSLITNSFSATSGNDYTNSVWVKSASGGERIAIRGAGASGYTAVDVTTEWQRVEITETSGVTGSRNFEIGLRGGVVSGISDSATVYLWGGQVEEGAFLTSYIPTSGSTVTRSADDLSITGTSFTDFYNQDEGTLLLENNYIGGANISSFNRFAASINDGTVDDRILIYNRSGDSNGVFINAGGVSQYTASGGLEDDSFVKSAHTFSSTRVANFKNGEEIGSEDTSITMPTVDQITIGSRVTGGNYLNGYIKRLVYFPKTLTDAELQRLTYNP